MDHLAADVFVLQNKPNLASDRAYVNSRMRSASRHVAGHLASPPTTDEPARPVTIHDNSNNSSNNYNYALLLPLIIVTVSGVPLSRFGITGARIIHLSSVSRRRDSVITGARSLVLIITNGEGGGEQIPLTIVGKVGM